MIVVCATDRPRLELAWSFFQKLEQRLEVTLAKPTV